MVHVGDSPALDRQAGGQAALEERVRPPPRPPRAHPPWLGGRDPRLPLRRHAARPRAGRQRSTGGSDAALRLCAARAGGRLPRRPRRRQRDARADLAAVAHHEPVSAPRHPARGAAPGWAVWRVTPLARQHAGGERHRAVCASHVLARHRRRLPDLDGQGVFGPAADSMPLARYPGALWRLLRDGACGVHAVDGAVGGAPRGVRIVQGQRRDARAALLVAADAVFARLPRHEGGEEPVQCAQVLDGVPAGVHGLPAQARAERVERPRLRRRRHPAVELLLCVGRADGLGPPQVCRRARLTARVAVQERLPRNAASIRQQGALLPALRCQLLAALRVDSVGVWGLARARVRHVCL
mmetsp:Transcript_51771/g.171557  ORF Transcript_51771/g.171557 Transcript_51771/m.171557 type:complete len:354 (-) Transcript_51771:207-1268(-)